MRSDDVPLVIDADDADPDTAGHQIALSEAGGAPTETNIAAIVVSGDVMAVDSYLVAVTREAPPSDNTALDTLEGAECCSLRPPRAPTT